MHTSAVCLSNYTVTASVYVYAYTQTFTHTYTCTHVHIAHLHNVHTICLCVYIYVTSGQCKFSLICFDISCLCQGAQREHGFTISQPLSLRKLLFLECTGSEIQALHTYVHVPFLHRGLCFKNLASWNLWIVHNLCTCTCVCTLVHSSTCECVPLYKCSVECPHFMAARLHRIFSD